MDPPLFFLLLITEHNQTNQYIHISNSKMIWTESRDYCKQHYTDLASVKNQTEWEKVKNILFINKVWIGLRKVPRVWVWSNQSVNSYTGDQNATYPFICYDDELVLVQENKTWSDAVSYCREHGWELVSVLNQNIQDWVQHRAQNASSPFVWLGLRYSCALGFWFWVSGNDSCYQNWAGGQNHNTASEQARITGAMNRTGGQWVSQPENETYNFICSRSHDELVLVQENKTWSDAVSHCREHGWELVSVLNQNIQDLVQHRAQNASSPFVWLGLRYSCALGFWFWVNEKDSSYQNWAGRQNDNTASGQARITGAMNRTGGHWVSQPENETYNFICSRSHDY
ncbi:hypothetical protein DPEC_G00229510 [Dallia pectoralis]|uniref:Uncharacterized protein n=1 Tax=Dallia pectoralis TaxID=75939 RepID=A0ACC2G1T0_DALPE|nr:hypothetical protein DPEC_G00229510 [Dallia pectoralis]